MSVTTSTVPGASPPRRSLGRSRPRYGEAAIKAAGGEMKAFYLTMGAYDAVAISEAPSNEAYARTMLAIATAGAVRTETLCAFPEEEYRKIVSG